MKTRLDILTQFIYKYFKTFWVALTLVILTGTLFYNENLISQRQQRILTDETRIIANRVDSFIEDLFQEIYTLPVYGTSFPECNAGLHEYLQHITLNNPRISGLIISDTQQKPVCSTLPVTETLRFAPNTTRSITGPLQLSIYDQPVYLLQQKMGNYYVGIIVLSSALQTVLKSANTTISSLLLYQPKEKRTLLRVHYSANKSLWVLNRNPEKKSPMTSQQPVIIEKLHSMQQIELVCFANQSALFMNLITMQSLIALGVLLASLLVYVLLKGLITRRYSLKTAMKSGIKNNEFFPVFQPIFDHHQQQFRGAEVLLRWQDNQDEIIMPDFFIEEAETNGLIVPITLQIMDQAFRLTKDIMEIRKEFYLSFNISALHFKAPYFFDEFFKLIHQYGITPQQILLEITERDLLNKNDAIFINRMKELRHLGYALAVDDYGTGHASISYLQHFPFSHLKIDKVFIQAIGTKAITESLNGAIIKMANDLDLIIIAEGVESQDQVDYLSANNVRFLQGWYFSKALPINLLTDLLEE